jgi:hypothetical protein
MHAPSGLLVVHLMRPPTVSAVTGDPDFANVDGVDALIV